MKYCTSIDGAAVAVTKGETAVDLSLEHEYKQSSICARSAAVTRLARVVEASSTLEYFSVARLLPGLDNLTALAAALAACKSLRRLTLYDCALDEINCAAFAEVLRGSASLMRFTVVRGSVSDAGAGVLFSALPHVAQLKSLRFEQCGLTAVGAHALAAALPSCRSISELSLVDNDFGEDGVSALAAVLPDVPSLERLGVFERGNSDAVAAALASAMMRRKTHLTIGLPCSFLSSVGCVAIARATMGAPHGFPLDFGFLYHIPPKLLRMLQYASDYRAGVVATLALLGKPISGDARGRATRIFFELDGDHAAWLRVVRMLEKSAMEDVD